MSNLSGISKHNERNNKNYSNEDIDPTKSELNYHFKKPIERSYEKEFERLRKENDLKGNLRLTGKKQSNVACEFLITSDKDFFQSMGHEGTKKYFEDAYKFACDKCGEKNIISAVVHMDETTPHMHLTYIPVVQGLKKGEKVNKINASEFWKGFNSYGKLQDEFYEHCKDRGYKLERGEIKEDKAKHLTVEEFKLETKKEHVDNALKSLSKVEEHVKGIQNKLDSVEAKRTPFGAYKLSIDDYNTLHSLAREGNSKILENMKLRSKVSALEDRHSRLESEYKLVSKDNSKLFKENMTVKRENMAMRKSFNRMEKAVERIGATEKVNSEIGKMLNQEKSIGMKR